MDKLATEINFRPLEMILVPVSGPSYGEISELKEVPSTSATDNSVVKLTDLSGNR